MIGRSIVLYIVGGKAEKWVFISGKDGWEGKKGSLKRSEQGELFNSVIPSIIATL
jgi:hypothetical protein